MDFFSIGTRETKTGLEVFPDFIVGRSKDLMVRSKSFYAVWDEQKGLWSTDEYDVQRIVDDALHTAVEQLQKDAPGRYSAKYLRSFGSNGWAQFRRFLQNVSDNSKQLDETLTFSDTEVKKSDFVSKRLPYSLSSGDCPAWNELVGTLYSVEERAKIEWAIGAIVSGDAKRIQKFVVLYGPAGTGKSTVLNIIQKLFEGYTTTFEAKALGSNNGSFATEAFKDNPLVAIQHDGDLSKIEDNTRLNSIIAHEDMVMNEKYKPSYTSRVNAFLFMGTNQPVKISDAKSGIIRRLIDVHPTGVKISPNHYNALMQQIDFELGAIAHHCLGVYRKMGKNYYNTYRPLEMMLQTDVFFNFIEANYDIFKEQDATTLKQAYSLYKEFCSDTGIDRVLPQYKVREELRNYFDEFLDRGELLGTPVRSLYRGFTASKFKEPVKNETAYSLVLNETESVLDELLAQYPAQLAKADGTPKDYWSRVRTTLADINTKELHYVRVPENHIVIDFDLKGDDGAKSLDRNLRAASSWPATYAELSQGGGGVHLHYIYTGGDPRKLRADYSDGIEVKVYTGRGSLRRRVSLCNDLDVSEISSGLPLKEEKPVLSDKTIKSEKGLRDLIHRNLRKEFHPGTKPSIDFIKKILDDAYQSGLVYDVTDLRGTLIAFANNSSHQPLVCIKTVQDMKFQSEAVLEEEPVEEKDPRLVLFDVEVFPNLFVVCWKYQGSSEVVRMVNPSPADIEQLVRMKLVGFYNRRYDNHILYARMLGYDNKALFALSQKMVAEKSPNAMFGEAYGLSYADIWDFSSKKESLKRFEIDLGIHHMELDIPWDQDVPDDMVEKVVEYCANDVIATEAVLNDREQDFVARQILAELSGLSVNHTTQQHTAKIIFQGDKRPQDKFVYTDLSKEFPGYVYDSGRSTYLGVETGEGGYVYAEPGIYENVALLDVASMHPTSIEHLNLFGPYTKRFSALKEARLAIKHKDYASARKMLDGKLAPFLNAEEGAEALAYALKIVINIVYGLTSAKFDNPFRDVRNKDNIVAKRGALFMIDLKHFVQEQGFTVAHIKTDSIKIPNATPEIIEQVMRFGEKYGYQFEHETTYSKFCLVNDAVYIARTGSGPDAYWTAVGAQFAHPYVFKTLFCGDEIQFADLCETKQVTKGAMYIDFDAVEKPMVFADRDMHFVGRSGLFVPVISGGGILYRVNDDKAYAVTGTKGWQWIEAEIALEGPDEHQVDMTYFYKLVQDARKQIEKFGGTFEDFIKE